MNQKLKTFILWGVLITLILLVIVVVQGKQGIRDVKFSEFQDDVKNDRVSKVEIRGRTITYTRDAASGPETVQTFGVEPDLEHWPDLQRALLFGPLAPSCFRLEGPDALPDAQTRFACDAAAFGAITSNDMTARERRYWSQVRSS